MPGGSGSKSTDAEKADGSSGSKWSNAEKVDAITTLSESAVLTLTARIRS
jgi:hypothetical protein